MLGAAVRPIIPGGVVMVRAIFVRVVSVIFCLALVLGLIEGFFEPHAKDDARGVSEASLNAYEFPWSGIVKASPEIPGAWLKTHRNDKESVRVVVISEGESSSFTLVRGLGFAGKSIMGVTPQHVTFLPTSREVIVDEGVVEGLSLVLRVRALKPEKGRPTRLYVYDVTDDGEVLLGYRGHVALIGPGLVSGLYFTTGSSGSNVREDGGYPCGLMVENLGFWSLDGGRPLQPGVSPDHVDAYLFGVMGRYSKTRRTLSFFPAKILGFIAKSLAWGEYFRDLLTLAPQKNLVILVSERWLGKGPLYEPKTAEPDKRASAQGAKAKPTSDKTLDLAQKLLSDRLGLVDFEAVASKIRNLKARPPSGQSIMVIRELRIAGLNTDFETLLLGSEDLPLILSRLPHNCVPYGAVSRFVKTEGNSYTQPLFEEDGFCGPGIILSRTADSSRIGIRFFPMDTNGDVAAVRTGVYRSAKPPSGLKRGDVITVRPGETVRCVWGFSPKMQHAIYGEEHHGVVKGTPGKGGIEVVVPPILDSTDQDTPVEAEDLPEDLKGRLLASLSEGGGLCAIFVSNLGEFPVADWGVMTRDDR